MKREFLELAHDYDAEKHQIRGMFMSEKLDGQRVLWDGGIARGLLASTIPWANTAKNARFIDPVHATGLWSRYGHPINAPDWFLDQLPVKVCLDGEMYMDGATVQDLGFLRAKIPDSVLWSRVRYHVFNMPTYRAVFQDGEINNPNFKKRFLGLLDRIEELAGEDAVRTYDKDFTALATGDTEIIRADNVLWHQQVRLPSNEADAREEMLEALVKVTDRGGEGLILRAPFSVWYPKRTDSLLKVKKFQDSEGKVIGYKAGKGKYLGMLGSLLIQWNNRKFELSGFTDAQRTLTMSSVSWAEKHPGEASSVDLRSDVFPIGTSVTFRYRDITNDGIPKEARYWRHG